MLESKLGLFQITKIEHDEGFAYLKDVLTNDEYKIVDIALSGNTTPDKIYVYTRLLHYQDICFNAGPNFVFDTEDDFIKKHISDHKKDYTPEKESLRFSQLYNHFSARPDPVRVFKNAF